MVAGADKRSAGHLLEAHLTGGRSQHVELFGRQIANYRQMLRRGTQVLPQCQKVDPCIA